MEGAQQATVLVAQAFTTMITFLVVASALGQDESDIADRINDRFDIHGSAARSVEALFNDAGEVESAVTWVSVVILVLSATSFTRALQKMFQRAYGPESRGWTESWRGLGSASARGISGHNTAAVPIEATAVITLTTA